jgi:hypothetical protein
VDIVIVVLAVIGIVWFVRNRLAARRAGTHAETP